MKWVLCNDDFGITHGLTDAVAECHRQGVTTCAAVRVDGVAFEYAVHEIWPGIPDLELGLHLNLTEGKPVVDPGQVPDLVDDEGYFRRSFTGLLHRLRHGGRSHPESRTSSFLDQIETEFRAQFRRLREHEVPIHFVNGNQHVHMIPGIFELVCRLTLEHGCRFVRCSSEPFFISAHISDHLHSLRHLNPIKHVLLNALSRPARQHLTHYGLHSVGAFVGILNTGKMNPDLLVAAARRLRKIGVVTAEVLFHPADIDHPADLEHRESILPYYFWPDRVYEKRQLLSRELGQALEQTDVELTTHQQLGTSEIAPFDRPEGS